MKKLALLLAAVLITAWSSNVFGQNTGDKPSIGSTHTYYVNSPNGTDHDAAHEGNTYAWWISTDATDLTTSIAAGTDFTVASGTYGATGDVNNNAIELTWNPSAASGTYYLVVKEIGSDGMQCSNLKAMAIQPQNDFALNFVALDESSNDADDPTQCAPDIDISATGATINYDYGVGEYIFKLTASGLYTNWSFDTDFAASSLGNATPTYEYQVGGTSGAWTAVNSGTPIPVAANTAGSEEVFIRVSVDNGDNSGTYEEGTGGQTISLKLLDVKDSGDNAATITNAAAADITATPVQTQVVKARPATSTIGFN